MFEYNAHIQAIYNREQLQQHMQSVGADQTGIRIMKQKGEFFHVHMRNVSLQAANIIKQEMLSKGGEACIPKHVSQLRAEPIDMILFGSRRTFSRVIGNFRIQPFGLKRLAGELQAMFEAFDQSHDCEQVPAWARTWQLPLKKRTLIMGILNVTPDSFSDGGQYNSVETAIARAKEMVAEGADMLDIGGESTRPGAEPVGLDMELQRVVPIVAAVSKAVQVPISIDTYKAEVAEKAIQAGGHIINDVWGGKKDENILEVAARLHVPIILMHNRFDMNYQDLLSDIIADLRGSITKAISLGVNTENIILDPGIGFAKEYEHNLEVMYRLREICNLGFPVLLGTSRKSLIAKTLNLAASERLEGSLATVCLGIERGVDIVRVHDVQATKRAAQMTDAMVRR